LVAIYAEDVMYFVSKHWGDLASVLGFALTIWFAWRAKTASEQARDAAEEVRDQLSRFDTIAELSAAITIIEEIMRLQRTQAWEIVWDIVLDRHSTLRGHLVRSQAGIESEALRASVRAAVSHFRIIVGKIERARTKPLQGKLDTAAFNQRLSDQIEVLEKVRIGVKKAGV
jgi:hypothetical protein